MEWDALQDRLYTVYWTTNLIDGFQVLESGLEYLQNSHTGIVESADYERFYRVEVQLK